MEVEQKLKPEKRHVVKAWEAMPHNREDSKASKFFIEIENSENIKGVAPIVKFTLQSDPIGEVGINGCQASDMLEYVKRLFISLDNSFPCEENQTTIKHINLALEAQTERTANRIKREVEGTNAL